MFLRFKNFQIVLKMFEVLKSPSTKQYFLQVFDEKVKKFTNFFVWTRFFPLLKRLTPYSAKSRVGEHSILGRVRKKSIFLSLKEPNNKNYLKKI